ncbi:hypothetical protein [Desulfosporosinus sp. BICA1-9]|uniref:hypothetical protein n=1 Tax=Desulfosporosinus sp. BICA1-9 TaxID=1531958 RepID=UPI000E82A5EB|nr:hypothetical protein [Desulfosporosinus sp. BICA1-9]HBW38577.1 hypothetical protein [Desulfosporosinus sp.]
MKQIIEEREETCSIVSKLVRLRIFRNRVEGGSMYEGEIVGFDCGSSSTDCLSKCHYQMMMNDF